MKLRTVLVGTGFLAAAYACSAPAKSTERPERKADKDCFYGCKADPKPDGGPTAAPAKRGPVAERAQLLREGADQLDRAQAALDNGNKNLAEQLFSTAELLVGPEVVAPLARQFRDGAPPRITAPTQKFDVAAAPPQPKAAGSSEAEDEQAHVAPPRVEASLAGTMQIDGRPMNGAYGLVTLEPADGKWKPRSPKRVEIEQRNREFKPHITAVSVGSTVAFPNIDTVFHNVFSTSPQGAFDLGLYKAGESREFTFQKEGVVRLGCNLHANMTAYIAVVSAPAYVVTNDNGTFEFKHLPPGRYKLKAWSERSKAPIAQDVTLKAGKNDVNVGVAGDAPAGPLPDKFGGKRG